MERIVCAVDLGGTKINTGLIKNNGEIIKSIRIPTNAFEGPEAVINRIRGSIFDILKAGDLTSSDILGIGVGSPGPLDPIKGEVISSANLPGWDRVPIVKILQNEFNVPVVINNDANSGALGEYIFGCGRGTKNFVYMTVSTGIGGGVIIDGKLYSGANCNAAEIGHGTIDYKGPRCKCGNFGCLEVFASGTALAQYAKESIRIGKKSIINEISDVDNIKGEHIFEAARLGDKLALELVEREAFYLGIGISNIMMYFNPEKIAIGGGVSNQFDMLYDKMMETVIKRTLKPIREICPVVKAELGDKIGIIGAAALIINKL